MKSKAQLLKERFGFDFRDAIAFRAVSVAPSTLPVGGLATTTEDALARINASPYVKKDQTEADVYIHTLEAGSTRFIADRFMFLDESTIQNVATEAKAGFAFLTKHDTYGQIPYGRTFAGATDTKDGFSRAVVQIYMLRGHSPNGNACPSTDDLDKGMVGGTLFDVSLNFKSAGITMRCDVCEKSLYGSDCPHYPGSLMAMSEDDVERQKTRGVPEGRASCTLVNGVPAEISLVYSGAIPNAGTAFAEQADLFDAPEAEPTPAPAAPTPEPLSTQPAAPSASEEDSMYSKELKIKLGLSENATDAEVDTKLAELNGFANRVNTLEAEAKKNADAAFSAKYAEKLGAGVIASLLPLANRDAVAEQFAAEKEAASKPTPAVAPPVGNPLAGAALQQTPNVTPGAAASEESETWRKGMGKFGSDADLNKAVMTAPMDAMARVLGVKTLNPTPAHQNHDAQALANRKQVFGIAAA